MKTVDVTGLSCPEPVVRTMAALKGLPVGEKVVVLADTVTARDNIMRKVQQMDCEVSVTEEANQFSLTITRKA